MLQKFPEALLMVLKLHNKEKISEVMETCEDETTLKQMAYMIGRQRIGFETENEDLHKIISYEFLSTSYISLGRELDVLQPKTPEQIYKMHLEERKGSAPQTQIHSARQNLASTYVNAFVNAGFGTDTLITTDTANQWLGNVKDNGKQAASASIGKRNKRGFQIARNDSAVGCRGRNDPD